jgi:type II secretory pathway component GspD/PulD (secretin)
MKKIAVFLVSFLLSFNVFSKDAEKTEEGYTINFENVELKELLQFISKIGNLNLIYNESEIGFNISFISDKPTSLSNVKSALIQILRINDLSLIEEGNNLIIHKNPNVKQIPAVVSSENPIKGATPPLQTRVFKIHKGNPTTIAAIITPLLSTSALVEVSVDTMQIIITDVASSIDTIKELLKSLDVANSPHDIEIFEAENMEVSELAIFAQKLMTPIAKGTTLEIIPQKDTSRIFIISTPFLIDRTLSLLDEIDKGGPIKGVKDQKIAIALDNVLIYPLKHLSHNLSISILEKILKDSTNQGLDTTSLRNIVSNSSYIKSAHSIVFVGLPSNLALLLGLLQNIDVNNNLFGNDVVSFLLFETKGMNMDEILKIIEEISKNLAENGYPDQALLHVLNHASPIEDLNAVLFVVPSETKEQLVTLLNSIISSYNVDLEKTGISHFYLYNIVKSSQEQMADALKNLTTYLQGHDYPNENLIKTIQSMQWIKASNSLFFVGNTKSLKEIAEILPSLDVPAEKSQEVLKQSSPPTEFVVFTPKFANIADLQSAISETREQLSDSDLSDPAFMQCLQSVKILTSSQQLLFTGSPTALARLLTLLESLDTKSLSMPTSERNVYIYKLRHSSATELISQIKSIAAQSKKVNGVTDLYKALDSVKYVKNSNSLVFVGADSALKKVAELVAEIDDSSLGKQAANRNVEGYQIYVPQFASGPELIQMVSSFESHLVNSGMTNEALSEVIDHLSYVKKTNTIIVSGEKEAVLEVIALFKQFDNVNGVADGTNQIIDTLNEQGFLLYKIQNVEGNDIVDALKKISGTLKSQSTNVIKTSFQL